MKQPILLNKYKYTIPVSALALAEVNHKSTKVFARHLPLMKVLIDFEKGSLKLEGDWQFMLSANKHNQPGWFRYYRERVFIDTVICPAGAINLNDHCSDGLLFPLEGTVADGTCTSSCSGLLVIDNERDSKGGISNNWNISFYLYDLQFEECEINFKLPLYIDNTDEPEN